MKELAKFLANYIACQDDRGIFTVTDSRMAGEIQDGIDAFELAKQAKVKVIDLPNIPAVCERSECDDCDKPDNDRRFLGCPYSSEGDRR